MKNSSVLKRVWVGACLLMVVVSASIAEAQSIRWGNSRGRSPELVMVDEVHFYDSKTIVAIRNCNRALERDVRCSNSNYECSACSEIDHSDHSSYMVYQYVGRGGRDLPRTPDRDFIQTFHFTDNKTAIARQKCENYRARLPQCMNTRDYECTPCTIESHTDHSQFDLYRIRQGRRW
ncbi:MAG: hypothetical protein NDI61_09690 [Bdellovibrionaceae bacterium]|nr:hypothetical protein [Pseudobdellovibrionaceae bacterium]